MESDPCCPRSSLSNPVPGAPSVKRTARLHRRALRDPGWIHGTLTELVASAADINVYRNGLLDLLDRLVGFDLATVLETPDGVNSRGVLRGYDSAAVLPKLSEFPRLDGTSVPWPTRTTCCR